LPPLPLRRPLKPTPRLQTGYNGGMEKHYESQHACPLCGGTEFAEGKVSSTWYGPRFMRDGRTIFNDPLPEKVRAIKCLSCGYLLQFAGSPATSRP
jgi:hypothetical protein